MPANSFCSVLLFTFFLTKSAYPAIGKTFSEKPLRTNVFSVGLPQIGYETSNSTRKGIRHGRQERSISITLQRDGKEDVRVSFSEDGKITSLVDDAVSPPYNVYIQRPSFGEYVFRVETGGVWKYETTITYDKPWTWVTAASFSEDRNRQEAFCEHITRSPLAQGQTVRIPNFRASRRCGLLAVSLCHDMERTSCYVVRISGFLSGKLKHTLGKDSSPDQGVNRFVPAKTEIPVQQEWTTAHLTFQKDGAYMEIVPQRYDEGGKIYNVYIEKTSARNYIISLESPLGKFSVDVKDYQWFWASAATYSRGRLRGTVCQPLVTKRRLQEGQTIPIYGVKATRQCALLGISLCEDKDHNACYVVDFDGLLSDSLRHTLGREFSSETGYRWIPGRGQQSNMQEYPDIASYAQTGNVIPTVQIGSPIPTTLFEIPVAKPQVGTHISTADIGRPISTAPTGNGNTIEQTRRPIPTAQAWRPVSPAQIGTGVQAEQNFSTAQPGDPVPTVQTGNGSPTLHTESEACGIGSPVAQLIAFGSPANLHSFPWHVGVFLKPDSGHICGGTLVRSNLVISAAHCFHNGRSQDVLLDKSRFILAVGKVSRNISDYEPDQQFSEVTSLIIAERYRGFQRRFEHDIAFVGVNFNINSVIRPVCVDWSGRILPPLRDGDVGMVAGWGLTENGAYSNSLKFARMPYIPLDRCEKVVPKSFFPLITADKFCAGNVNGPTVRRGDSGGGLIFLRDRDSPKGRQWYLRGVVSVGTTNGELTYSAFVDVSNFIPAMRDKL